MVIARIRSDAKPLKLQIEVPEHASARVSLCNRVVDMSLPEWRFSDSAKLRMNRLFDAIDFDGSGELDVAEWKSFLTEQVSIRWKNPDFVFRNPDFLIRNPDCLSKQC